MRLTHVVLPVTSALKTRRVCLCVGVWVGGGGGYKTLNDKESRNTAVWHMGGKKEASGCGTTDSGVAHNGPGVKLAISEARQTLPVSRHMGNSTVAEQLSTGQNGKQTDRMGPDFQSRSHSSHHAPSLPPTHPYPPY